MDNGSTSRPAATRSPSALRSLFSFVGLARPLWIFHLLTIPLAMGLMWKLWLENPNYDVAVWWEAGTRMRLGGGGLYGAPSDGVNEVGPYIYPPTFAVLFAPLTWLGRPVGYAVWGLLLLVLLAVALLSSARAALADRAPGTGRPWLLVPWLGLALYGSILTNVREGQVNALVLLAIGSGLTAILRGREASGGALLAVAAHLKILPGALLPLLLVRRRWRAAGGMVAGLAALYLLPLVWTVPSHGAVDGVRENHGLHVEYVASTVLPRLQSQDVEGLGGSGIPNNSLNAVARRWFGDGARLSNYLTSGPWTERFGPLVFALPEAILKWLGIPLAVLMYLGTLALAVTVPRTAFAETVLAGLAVLSANLANPLFWEHHMLVVALLVAPLLVVAHRDGVGRGRALLVLVLAGTGTLVSALGSEPLTGSLAVWGAPTLCVLAVAVIAGRAAMTTPLGTRSGSAEIETV